MSSISVRSSGEPIGAGAINVTEIIDNTRLGGRQIAIIAICMFVAMMDGFDSQVAGVTGPGILAALKLQPTQLGLVFSANSWGFIFGALIGGPCADKFGRKPILLLSTTLFALCTFVTPLILQFDLFMVVRVLAGVGFGAATPCFVSIATECVPRKWRSRLVTILWAAIPGGGVAVGFLGPIVLPSLGWQWLFYIGGAASFVAALLVALALPESVIFAVMRGYQASRVSRLLGQLTRSDYSDVSRFFVEEERHLGAPVKLLFVDGRALTTILVWIAFFADYFVLFGMIVWTPTLLGHLNVTPAQASAVLAFNNIGGIIGASLAGYLIYNFGPYRTLITTFVVASVTIALTGLAAPEFAPVVMLQTLSGFLAGGGHAGMVALAAMLYPTTMRSTGVGWGLGVGRLGGAGGPIVIGALVGAGWSASSAFAAIGFAALPVALIVGALRLYAAKAPAAIAAKTPAASSDFVEAEHMQKVESRAS
ncbi:MFS transporter [Bradyrhizobium mercantei]|uniref:MFS transporter n=1 Tax=Bradyrhizobium mercantei TaxID=1904807 RepID=UPI000976ABD3|nr:MFS transporter [Bradyrhizobium mercantei]